MSNNNEQHGNSSLQKIHQDFREKMMSAEVGEDNIALFIQHIKNEKDARFIEETMQDVVNSFHFNFGLCGCDDIGIHSPEKVFKKILINEFLNHYDKHKNTYQMYFDLSENCKLKDRDKYFDTDIWSIYFDKSREIYRTFSTKTEYDNIFHQKNSRLTTYDLFIHHSPNQP